MTDEPLVCPSCGSERSKVADTGNPLVRQRARIGWRGKGRWRLRICRDCQTEYVTTETVTGIYAIRKKAQQVVG